MASDEQIQNPPTQEPAPTAGVPLQPTPPSQPQSPAGKNLNDIINMAKQKGEQTRSAPTSVDNLAKSAWKQSTPFREQFKKSLNAAYSVVTGLTNKEVRKELNNYVNKVQPPKK
jgi:hypothetical protein